MASRGLTRGFAGFFADGTAIFPVRAMGYELCGMRMKRSAAGKSMGGDFVGERVEGWEGASGIGVLRLRLAQRTRQTSLRTTAENKQQQEQATTRTGNGKNRQRQEPMRGFFAALRMTNRGAAPE